MTCIVGLAHKGKVYMGCDSLGSNGFTKTVRREHKVFENGEYLIGGTTSFRMLNLLEWKFNPPTIKREVNLHKFMCTEFVDELRKLFVENGFCITTSDWKSGEFLVGVQGRLFYIEEDFQVSEREYAACGSGEYHAVGSLYSSKRKNPIKSITKALECAENFVVSVRSPFIIKSK